MDSRSNTNSVETDGTDATRDSSAEEVQIRDVICFIHNETNARQQDFGKPWLPGDEYKFAPIRPEGDLWKHILDQKLASEKIRCKGWEEEIGNLLIFAGLFSAVATAFIIESYKTLKPDRGDDIVSLLSQILKNPGNRAIETADLPSNVFSPSQSAVRVNIFWLLSLVLSLATALVGIIALQWLRDFQLYPGESSKENIAIHHMRAKGMEKWHVWKILMALPLLLQIALILFFAGVVDFLHALESRAVFATVSAAIGIILLFFIATTTLPAIQPCLIFLRFLLPLQPGSNVPSPCPYKSAQSRLIREIIDLSLLAIVIPTSTLWTSCLAKAQAPVIRYLGALLFSRSWREYDAAWLNLRDSYSRSTHDEQYAMREDEVKNLPEISPIFDVVGVLRETFDGKYISDAMLFAYHCFTDLSQTFTTANLQSSDDDYYVNDITTLRMRNRHLLHVFHPNFSDSIVFDHLSKEGSLMGNNLLTSDAIELLHEWNMFMLLDHRRFKSSPGISNDTMAKNLSEIRIRIQREIFGRKSSLSPDMPFDERKLFLLAQGHIPNSKSMSMLLQHMHVVRAFITYIGRSDTVLCPGDLHAHPMAADFLQWIGTRVARAIAKGHGHQTLFNTLANLSEVMASSLDLDLDSVPSHPTPALYCAAIFVRPIAESRERLGFNISCETENALKIIHKYRKKTIDKGLRNEDIEEWYKWETWADIRFTSDWWSFLDMYDIPEDNALSPQPSVIPSAAQGTMYP